LYSLYLTASINGKLALRRSTSETHVFFRFWLMTSLIVAFVAFSGAFGIQLVPAANAPGQSADRDLGLSLAVIDDGGR
jgi:hypothetical protein